MMTIVQLKYIYISSQVSDNHISIYPLIPERISAGINYFLNEISEYST
jgi:hypothetical protein